MLPQNATGWDIVLHVIRVGGPLLGAGLVVAVLFILARAFAPLLALLKGPENGHAAGQMFQILQSLADLPTHIASLTAALAALVQRVESIPTMEAIMSELKEHRQDIRYDIDRAVSIVRGLAIKPLGDGRIKQRRQLKERRKK